MIVELINWHKIINWGIHLKEEQFSLSTIINCLKFSVSGEAPWDISFLHCHTYCFWYYGHFQEKNIVKTSWVYLPYHIYKTTITQHVSWSFGSYNLCTLSLRYGACTVIMSEHLKINCSLHFDNCSLIQWPQSIE